MTIKTQNSCHSAISRAKDINFNYLTLVLLLALSVPAKAQLSPLPEGKSEYRYNQSNGVSNSVSVGITSGFGVNGTAQASPSYNASSTASMILKTEAPSTLMGGQTLPNYNSSVQVVGTEANNSPVNVKINSQTIQVKATDGSTTQDTIGSKQIKNATNYNDNGSSSSTADFSAEGFGAVQDLRFLGGSSDGSSQGSKFTADVLPILNIDDSGNTSSASNYGTGSASSNAESRTRFQADITTSIFVNTFASSF